MLQSIFDDRAIKSVEKLIFNAIKNIVYFDFVTLKAQTVLGRISRHFPEAKFTPL